MRNKSAERPARPDITPRLSPTRRYTSLAVSLAIVGAIAVYLGLTWALGLSLRPNGVAEQKLLVEVLKGSLAVAAGLGAVVALALNYRRHRIEESQSHRDDQRLFTERFQTAAEQLGHDKAPVRLAGVHALARLADDWEEQRQTCIDVLCAYLRLPAAEGDSPDLPSPAAFVEDREIRQTIVRLIAEHLRVDPDDSTRVSWQGHDLDFTGATFNGTFRFDRATFSGAHVRFDEAAFSGGTVSFVGAEFSGGMVSFGAAMFCGGTVDFDAAVFSDGMVDFQAAEVSGGSVSFVHAVFTGGTVSFHTAKFSGGTVSFVGATFSGVPISLHEPVVEGVSFVGSEFSGGTVDFDRAKFSGGTVNFHHATFSAGRVDFAGAAFSNGLVGFVHATFSGGMVTFIRALFSGGTVRFDRALFSDGTVRFDGALFSRGLVSFPDANFSGSAVIFVGAEFSGGRVDLSSAGSWEHPATFSAWKSLPEGLLLP